MSTKYFTAAPDAVKRNTISSFPLKPTDTATVHYTDDLEESMKHLVNVLEKMPAHNPPCNSDDNDEEKPQDAPQAVSTITSRVTDTTDALTELAKVACVHTDMLKSLQAANAALSEQHETTTIRLNQLDAEIRALRAAQAIGPPSTHMFNVVDSAVDEQHVMLSPDGHHHSFDQPVVVNPFVTHPTPVYHTSHWTGMSDIAATLAVAPQDHGSNSSASSRSSSSSHRERRPSKPHREEHVKRSRITYGRNGGQTPNISPTAFAFTARFDEQQEADVPEITSTQSTNKSMSCDTDSEENTEGETSSEPSLTRWLYGKATKALFRQ